MFSRWGILVAGIFALGLVGAGPGTASAAAPFRGTDESGSRSHPIVETLDVHYHDASSRQVLDIFARPTCAALPWWCSSTAERGWPATRTSSACTAAWAGSWPATG